MVWVLQDNRLPAERIVYNRIFFLAVTDSHNHSYCSILVGPYAWIPLVLRYLGESFRCS